MKNITLLITLFVSLLFFQNFEAQTKKTKRLKRPSSRVGIAKVDRFVSQSFNLYNKVYRYDSYGEEGKSLTDDDYEILLDAVAEAEKVTSSASDVVASLDGVSVLKQGKATLQINRSKKALRYSLRTAKKLLMTKGEKKEPVDESEETTVADNDTSTNSGNTSTDSSTNTNTSSTNSSTLKQPEDDISFWMTYDFIPGKEVIFFDNMQEEDYGDFPRRWDLTEGNAEVGRFGKERVLLFYNNVTSINPLFKEDKYLPEAFSIEFDIYFDELAAKRRSTYALYFDDNLYNRIEIKSYYPFEVSYKKFKHEDRRYHTKALNLTGWHHIAISYSKGYLKMYFDEQKVLNIPRLDFVPNKIKKIRVAFSEDQKKKRVLSIKNFKIAKGGGKPYAQVVADGKFVTHGILFDVGKASLRPQSSGVFKRVMDMMIDNPDWKFEIVGHTDSDGEEANNLTLSQKRAEAVKRGLINRGIDTSRLTTLGKGESEPLNTNSSPEEKANNRRVEFILKK